MKIKEDRELRAALYARVSTEHQAQEGTIASQVAGLKDRIAEDGLALSEELCFLDEGHSGSTLIRPALERLRDAAYSGGIDRLYVHAPDRLARKYAYQTVLVEELQGFGVELVFLNQALGKTPEEEMLLQVQGMVAEYERAKIVERTRRGKRYAARRGSVSALCAAPYGYRYITKHEGGGEARFQVLAEQAQVVQQIFAWIGQDRLSLREVCRRLFERGIPTSTGKPRWRPSTVFDLLTNPAYKGWAVYGKTRVGPRPPGLRPLRGSTAQRSISVLATTPEEQERIAVPSLVDEGLFDAVQSQLAENRRRKRESPSGPRHLLQGLIVCAVCGYAYCARPVTRTGGGGQYHYVYYRCSGSRPGLFGERLCRNRPVRADALEQAVWEDVHALLRDPERIAAEYERRWQKNAVEDGAEDRSAKLIRKTEQSISRLIDAYEDGILAKEELQSRLARAQERLKQLKTDAEALHRQEDERRELRLVVGDLEKFSSLVREGLQDPDWSTRRKIITALVGRVEIGAEKVHIRYRIAPRPFAQSPARGFWQDCWRRYPPPTPGTLPRARVARRVADRRSQGQDGQRWPTRTRGHLGHLGHLGTKTDLDIVPSAVTLDRRRSGHSGVQTS